MPSSFDPSAALRCQLAIALHSSPAIRASIDTHAGAADDGRAIDMFPTVPPLFIKLLLLLRPEARYSSSSSVARARCLLHAAVRRGQFHQRARAQIDVGYTSPAKKHALAMACCPHTSKAVMGERTMMRARSERAEHAASDQTQRAGPPGSVK
jgi:hypothetical protein